MPYFYVQRTLLTNMVHHRPAFITGDRYQLVADKATQKAVKNLEKAINTTVTYGLLSKPTTKDSAIFDDVMWYNLYHIHVEPTEPLAFQ